MFEDSDGSKDLKRIEKIIMAVLYLGALLVAFYLWLSEYGRLIGLIGSPVLTLAAFAIYQWVRVWLNARRQERGPEDDGAPITLNLNAPVHRDSVGHDESP